MTLFYTPGARDRALLPHDPLKAIVTPRPIGWISTLGADGSLNLAPYSFFNALGEQPPMVGFSSAGPKDSATFAGELREFVWNLATWELREAMNASSATLPRGESEFAFAALEAAPSRMVAPPRVAASPAALECQVVHHLDLRDVDDQPTGQYLVIGQVVGVHIDEAYVVDGRFDTAAARPIARCGYLDEYAVVDGLFHMTRPS